MLGTNQRDVPQNYRAGGGGQVITAPVCTTITNGAISGFQIANSDLTAPAGIYQRISIINPAQQTLRVDRVVQIHGATFNYDTFLPMPLTLPPQGGTVSGPLSITGNTSITGWLSLSQYLDAQEIAAPANPAAGFDRVFADLASHKLKCLTSSGADCNPTGAGGIPGGSNQQLQFNDSGVFSGDALFTFDKVAKRLLFGPYSSVSSNITGFQFQQGNFNVAQRGRFAIAIAGYAEDTVGNGEVDGGIFVAGSGLASTGGGSGVLAVATAFNAAGTSAQWTGIETSANMYGAGTVTELAGAFIDSNIKTAGTVTNNYGVHIKDQHGVGGTENSALRIDDQGTGAADYAINVLGGKSFLLGGLTVGDPTDHSKRFIFDTSNVAAANTRTVNVPNANSSFAQPISALAHKFVTAMSAQGLFTLTQPASTDLSDFSSTPPASSGQIPIYDQAQAKYIPGDPLVQGVFADGSASEPNPVLGGVWDGAHLRALSGDSSGRINVNINGTVPVSGTFWQATQPVSGTFWQSTQPVSGTFWQATQPTSLADGQHVTFGAKTDAKNSATDATSITAMQIWKEISFLLQNTLAVSGTFWQATQPVSGTVTANAGSGTFNNQQSNVTADYDTGAGTQLLTMFGIALPASGGAVAGGTATNPLRTDPTGSTTQPVSGAVTANAGTNLNTSALALDTSVTNVQSTAGTTTAPTKIAIIGGKSSDATPQYQPLPLTNSGAAVKTDGSATTQPVSGTFWQSTQPVSGTVTTSPPANASTNVTQVGGTAIDTNSGNKSAGTVRVVIATDQPTNTNALKVDGSAVTQPVSGTFWQATQPVSGTVTANQGTAAALSSAWPAKITDGTNTMPTMDAAARAGFHKITDGTNTAAVKAASTAAAASDPSLVVALSPNSPLPAGSSIIGKTTFDSTTPGSTNGVTLYQPARTTGSITAAGQRISVASTGYGLAVFTINGSYTGVVLVFEFSDDGGANWYPNTCARTDAPIQESSEVVAPNATEALDCSAAGTTNVSVRSTSWTSGTANVGITLSAAPIEPAPAVALANNPQPTIFGIALAPSKLGGSIVRGSFGRPVTSTGDALDVNLKYPPASFDPCDGSNKTSVPISTTANVVLIAGAPRRIALCSIVLISSSAESFSLVEGSGSACGTGTAAIIGSTTAANGPSLAANGGFTLGNGRGAVAQQQTPGNSVCLFISGSTLMAGNLTYAY